ncbi:hypothetical protein DFP91_3578 [Pseudorhodoplanes sinuspersici]|nr:hypothetical protein DFP91_3578 [Pseudorhodoplanes sinuspersici]
MRQLPVCSPRCCERITCRAANHGCPDSGPVRGSSGVRKSAADQNRCFQFVSRLVHAGFLRRVSHGRGGPFDSLRRLFPTGWLTISIAIRPRPCAIWFGIPVMAIAHLACFSHCPYFGPDPAQCAGAPGHSSTEADPHSPPEFWRCRNGVLGACGDRRRPGLARSRRFDDRSPDRGLSDTARTRSNNAQNPLKSLRP